VNERAKAIEKVRKLRALAERPGTEAEGATARDRADRLMAKHSITEADLAPPRPVQPAPPAAWPFPVQWGTVQTATTGSVFIATGNVYGFRV
jgi:hypothetical protein